MGILSWICESNVDFGSLCVQGIIIDVLNFIFLLAFSVFLLIGFVRKISLQKNSTSGWICTVTSVCCLVISIMEITTGFLFASETTNQEFKHWNQIVHMLRGLIWISLAVSLQIQGCKGMRVLVLIWWISFAVLASLLNIQILLKTRSLRTLRLVSWLVNLLLLVSSFRLIIHPKDENQPNYCLYQPLLDEVVEGRSLLGQASFFGRLTFSYINPMLRLGYSRPLRIDDIPAFPSEDGVLSAYQAFRYEWENINRGENLNISNLVILALAKCYWKQTLVIGIYAFLRALAVSSAPLLLYGFVRYSTSKERDIFVGWSLVGCLAFVKGVESLSQRHWFFDSRRYGMRMRSALMAAIFRKMLTLSSSGRRKHTTGEIVNYIAVDAYSLGESLWWLSNAVCLLLQLFFGIAVLFGVTGIGALPGLVPLLLGGLLNVPFAKTLQNCQSQVMAAQDDRLRATSEILNSMKIIKLQSWEEKFRQVIESLREREFKWLAESQIKKSYGSGLYWISPTIISAVVFAGCAITGSAPLNAGMMFTVLATLRVMAEPAKMLSEVLSTMIQVKVSLDRLNIFLLEDEIREEAVDKNHLGGSDFSVKIQRANFSWDPNCSTYNTLGDIDLEIRKGQKVAICGPVGAGKSSLLYAILGEIPTISGSAGLIGSVAYVSQTSWIQSGTLRDNILFGKPMDEARYEMAIRACALVKDIDTFDHGDLTEIGQRGLNMSGGQKQRIQLARAVYSDADVYLLDDPFSAVDAHTASILFNECVMSALEKKTVILVTHQVEFLSGADKILVIEDGKITQSGSYKELVEPGSAFERLVNAHQTSITALDSLDNDQDNKCQKNIQEQGRLSQRQSRNEDSKEEISVTASSKLQLTEDERMENGDFGWKPYIDYVNVSKCVVLLALVVIGQSAFIVFQAMSTYWLAGAIRSPSVTDAKLIGVYAMVSFLSAVSAFIRSWLAALMGLKASKAFFSGFTDSVFRAPMQFFDSTPVGRILTRASLDMTVIDFKIPFSINFTVVSAIEVTSTIIIMATATWQVLVVGIPVIILTTYIRGYYLASARELIRMNGTTKAPLMNYASEASLGVATIRAFASMDRFINNNYELIDTDAKLFFYTNAAMEWILIRVEALQNLTILTSAILLVLLPYGAINPGLVGLSLSYALTLTTSQVYLTRWYCNLDNYIISAERVKQFMEISPEPPAIIDDKRPPFSWPSEGRIDLEELQIRYRPNAPLVLKGITCTFAAGNKVGVVGRTGSGKTTLISALFRLVDPAGGRIVVDSIDICTIGLRDLRWNLSIIPQEATLFRGSVRSNLDPLGMHSDHEIWEVIEKCQLKNCVMNLPELLDSPVSDEGENWSSGQRQLFCLGRVLLKRNKILVLDEATASIDSATDAVLQRVIREEFSNCTVITIAHRVPTVADSDMVMVLSYGELVEYDKPSVLMDCDSAFSKLVTEYWSNLKKNQM